MQEKKPNGVRFRFNVSLLSRVKPLVKKIITFPARRRNRWEALCKQCGLCCYERRVLPGGRVYIDFNAPCEFLDTDTNLCTVYENRFRVCRYCAKVTMFHALFDRAMPPNCSYVEQYRPLFIRRLTEK